MRDELTLLCGDEDALSAVLFVLFFSASFSLNGVAGVGDFVGVDGTDGASDGRCPASADAYDVVICDFELPPGMVNCSTRAFKEDTVAESCVW